VTNRYPPIDDPDKLRDRVAYLIELVLRLGNDPDPYMILFVEELRCELEERSPELALALEVMDT
jgi:hypothetical protein